MHTWTMACMLWFTGGVLVQGVAAVQLPSNGPVASFPASFRPLTVAVADEGQGQGLAGLPIRRLPVDLRAPQVVTAAEDEDDEEPAGARAAAGADDAPASPSADGDHAPIPPRGDARAGTAHGAAPGEPGAVPRIFLQPMAADLLQRPQEEAVGASDLPRPPSRFDVRIVSPTEDARVVGRVEVRADVLTDRPEAIRAVDFIVDGRMLFSDSEPPYELTWDAGRPAAHRIEVRAYGVGRRVASDTVELLDPGDRRLDTLGFSARVEMVEVHVRVEDAGPDLAVLDPEAFEIFEEGVRQPIVEVESVSDLPIAIGLVVDCSGSMVERLDRALEAGGVFVEGLIRQAQDKAFVMSFSDLPTMMQGFTNDIDRLTDALSMMRGGRYTALYDSIVAASRAFEGVEGRRAIVVLTDGHDQGSDHRFDEAVAAAQRADVAIYPVAVDVSTRYMRERWIMTKLAEGTGGRVSYLDLRGDPSSIYEEIAADLRSQYRITYAPLRRGGAGEWRAIEVRVTGDDERQLTVRARPGYYAR